MTLNTSVAIGAPTDVKELFAFCRALLDTPADVPAKEGAHDDADDYRPRRRYIANPPSIGLGAWLWVYYGADGPFLPHRHDEYCPTELGGEYEYTQEDIDEHAASVAADPTDNGWAVIEVTFDTAYGYRGENGESCSDLHARLVTALGHWLDAKGLPWKWQNEYTGEWFDRYDQLREFGDAHRTSGAGAWFDRIVTPVIRSMGGEVS